MRAMLLEFPDDRTCRQLDRQYMLGPNLLVAPVFDDEGDVEFYVPAGRWVGLLDGQVVDGPGWVRQRHDFHSLPLLVRPGSVIAVGSRADRPDYDDAVAAPTFEVFDLADGDSTVTHLYDELGSERVSLQVARHGSEVVAEVVAGLEELTAGLAPDLGRRTVRRTDRTDRRGGVRAGDPRSRPRAVAAGIRDRMTVRNFHMLFTATYTRASRSVWTARRRLVGETT